MRHITVGVSEFAKTVHQKDKGTSYFQGTWEEVVSRVLVSWYRLQQGYRPGVILVPVPPGGFYSTLVELKEGDKLEGEYVARVPGETPRKQIRVVGRGAASAKYVDIVLYQRDVLEEEGEPTTGADWDIVTILARDTEESPMPPETLMANHFGDSGGTDTKMTPRAFEKALRESYWYWRGRAFSK